MPCTAGIVRKEMVSNSSVYGNSVNSSHIRQICPGTAQPPLLPGLSASAADALMLSCVAAACTAAFSAFDFAHVRKPQPPSTPVRTQTAKQAQKQNPSAATHQLHLPCLPRPHLPDFPLRKRPLRPPSGRCGCRFHPVFLPESMFKFRFSPHVTDSYNTHTFYKLLDVILHIAQTAPRICTPNLHTANTAGRMKERLPIFSAYQVFAS